MDKKNIKKSLVENSFWSIITSIVGRGGALIFTIILARFLMPERYGIFSIALSVSMFFYIFADIGINATAVRFISSALAKERKKAGNYYSYLLKLKLTLAITFFLLLIIFAYPLSHYIFKNEKLFFPFLAAAIYILFLSIEVFHSQLFYAIENAKLMSLKESLVQILRIILIVDIFVFVASAYQIVSIFIGLTVIHFLTFLIVLGYFKNHLPEIFHKSKKDINRKNIKNFVKFLTISSISGVFFMNIDAIILALFLGKGLVNFVGFYKASFSLVIGITTLLAAPNLALLPIFSRINKQDAVKVYEKILRYIILLSIPASIGLILMGKHVIRLLFGYEYILAANSLYILGFTILPIVSLSILLHLYSGKKMPEVFAKLIILASLCNLVLNFILISILIKISPTWAIRGAAIATVISWIFYFILALRKFEKDFKTKIPKGPFFSSIFSSTLMFITLLFLKQYFQEINLANGIALIFSGIIIYLLGLLIIGEIKKEDFTILKLIANRN